MTIGENVTSIGNYAFYKCDSLCSITIPNNVTFIGSSAFYGCSSLTSIEIPSSVISIGNSTFYGCAGELIVNCKIPSASSSTNGAFYGSKFKSVTIGDNVTSIGNYAFYDCDSLVSITIPNSVTSIGDDAFYGCEVLTHVSINSNTIVSTGDFSLCSIFGNQVTEYIIGKNVTSICAGKFCDCTGLAYITIPTSVTSIGNSAFRNCLKIESVTIPNSVTSIGDYALSDCANLKSVTIGSGVQVIGKDVFENHHPSKVIWLTNTPPEGYSYAEGTVNYVSNRQYTELSNVIRYSSLSSIFEVDGIRYVPVNPSERTCDAIDCTYNENIDTINIGEKVTNKGIELSVKQICPYTCFDNKHIKDINLSFKGDVGAKAFYGCSNMTTAELGKNILSIGESGFSKCSKLESIVIPDTMVMISDSTFCDCIALSSAKIGSRVDSIGRYAFNGCSVLPDIKIPKSVTSIADYAFRGCRSIKTVVMDNGDSELALSSNGSDPLFVDCPLDSVYIGRNILYETSVDYGYSPFYRNKTLRTVVITDKETEISDNEFYGCTNLQSFEVGDGVTFIGNWAFSGCSSLRNFSFGTQLKAIGTEAFSDCTGVTAIASKAITPPACGAQALDDINKWDCILYVPKGYVEYYQAADQWKDFFFIEEGDIPALRGDVNGDYVVNGTDIQAIINLIVASEYDEKADVNEDNKINGTDIQEVINIIVNGPDEDTDGDESGGDENGGDESGGDESGGDESSGDESSGDESSGDEDELYDNFIFEDSTYGGARNNYTPTAASGWELWHASERRAPDRDFNYNGSRIFNDLGLKGLKVGYYCFSQWPNGYMIYGNASLEGDPTLTLPADRLEFTYHAANWKVDEAREIHFQVLDADNNVVVENITYTSNKSMDGNRSASYEADKFTFKWDCPKKGQYKIKFGSPAGETFIGNISIAQKSSNEP